MHHPFNNYLGLPDGLRPVEAVKTPEVKRPDNKYNQTRLSSHIKVTESSKVPITKSKPESRRDLIRSGERTRKNTAEGRPRAVKQKEKE